MFTYKPLDPTKRKQLLSMLARLPVPRSVSDGASAETHHTAALAPLAPVYGQDPEAWSPTQQLLNAKVNELIESVELQPFRHPSHVIKAVAEIVNKHPECFRDRHDVVYTSIEASGDAHPSSLMSSHASLVNTDVPSDLAPVHAEGVLDAFSSNSKPRWDRYRKTNQLILRLRRRLGTNCFDLAQGRQPTVIKSAIVEECKTDSTDRHRSRVESLMKSIDCQVQMSHDIAPADRSELKTQCQEFHQMWRRVEWQLKHSDDYEVELAKFAKKFKTDLANHEQQRRSTNTAAEKALVGSTAPQSFSDRNGHSEIPTAHTQARKRTANVSGMSEVASNSLDQPNKRSRSGLGAAPARVDAGDVSEGRYEYGPRPVEASVTHAPFEESTSNPAVPKLVDSAYVNAHPHETFHHRGRGRWGRGLPTFDRGKKTAVRGPMASQHTVPTSQARSHSHDAIDLSKERENPGIVFRLSIPELPPSETNPTRLQWHRDMQHDQFLASVTELFFWGFISSITVRLARRGGRVEEREVGEEAVDAEEAWGWVRLNLILLNAQPSEEVVEIDTLVHMDGLGSGLEERKRRELSLVNKWDEV